MKKISLCVLCALFLVLTCGVFAQEIPCEEENQTAEKEEASALPGDFTHWQRTCQEYILAGRFDEANSLGLNAIRQGASAEEVKGVFQSVLWLLSSQPGPDCQVLYRKAKFALYPLPAMAADREMTAEKMRETINNVVPYMLGEDGQEVPLSGKGNVAASYRTMLTNALLSENTCMARFLLENGANPRLGSPSAMQMARNPNFQMDLQMRTFLLEYQNVGGKLIRGLKDLFRKQQYR